MMMHNIRKIIYLLLSTSYLITGLHAQVGKVGINTSTPAAMLHVKDSSVVFTGPSAITIPTRKSTSQRRQASG